MSESSTFVSMTEAASLAGVTPDTIRQFAKSGLLRTMGGGEEEKFSELDLRSVFRIQTPKEQPKEEAAPKAATEERISTEPETKQETQETTKAEDPVIEESRPEPQPKRPPERPDVQQADVSHAFELLEITRSLREQIEMLREERDWLRRRVEKMEDRTDRDQMALLSHTDVTRRLVDDALSSRRGFWSKTISWFRDKPRLER